MICGLMQLGGMELILEVVIIKRIVSIQLLLFPILKSSLCLKIGKLGFGTTDQSCSKPVPLDRMLAHGSPLSDSMDGSRLPFIHSWVERGFVGVQCPAQEFNTMIRPAGI